MPIVYTEEYLLEKLNELWMKHGKIQGVLIDKEPNFPTRKCYVRAFGSLENACNLIGYDGYKKHKFNIEDAQKILDERNGHFNLLNFNGMSKKCLIQCKECGTIEEIVPDSLLRNKTDKHFGCKTCNKQNYKHKEAVSITEEEHVYHTLNEIKEMFPFKDGYGYIYQILNLKNNKKYIGSTINPYQRLKAHIRSAYIENSKIYNYPLQRAIRKYGIENFKFSILLSNILIDDLASQENQYIIKYNTLINNGWGYNQTLETECALRDNNTKMGNCVSCALIDNNDNIIEVFDSYHDAARKLFNNNNSATKICAVCNGKAKTYKKMKFKKIERGGEFCPENFT